VISEGLQGSYAAAPQGFLDEETTKMLEGKAQETGHYTYSPRNKEK
jgi:hypothetical protein